MLDSLTDMLFTEGMIEFISYGLLGIVIGIVMYLCERK